MPVTVIDSLEPKNAAFASVVDANYSGTDTTNFNGILSGTDTDVQTALETIDDHGHTAADISDFDTEVSNNTTVTTNTSNIATNTTNIAANTSAIANAREALTADRTYYVATTGSDSNTGLTVGSPFLTIQKAIDTLSEIDFKGYTVTIDVANGTYSAGFSASDALTGYVVLVGDTTTPSNVTINATDENMVVDNHNKFLIKGFTLSSSTASCVTSLGYANVELQNVNFGTAGINHIVAQDISYISHTTNYTISGNAARHLSGNRLGVIEVIDVTVTLSGTPAFSTGYAVALNLSNITASGCTFSGSATGVRYRATGNSFINTSGSGATYLPGNSAGVESNGGIYN